MIHKLGEARIIVYMTIIYQEPTAFKIWGGEHSCNHYVLIVQDIRALDLDRVLVLAHVSENDLDLSLVPEV